MQIQRLFKLFFFWLLFAISDFAQVKGGKREEFYSVQVDDKRINRYCIIIERGEVVSAYL